MILIGQVYTSGGIDHSQLTIDGEPYKIVSLSFDLNEADEALTVRKGDTVLYDNIRYDEWTTDDTLFTPLASFAALAAAVTTFLDRYRQGIKVYKKVSTADTNVELVKQGGIKLFSIIAFNSSGNPAFLKLFDTGSIPDPVTDMPVMTFDTRSLPAAPLSFGAAVPFRNGLGIAVTAVASDLDNTAVNAGDLIFSLVYE